MAKRKRRRFLRLVLALILIAAGLALAAPFLPLPTLKTAAEDRLSQTLGRRVTVDSARVSLTDGPSLLLNGVTAHEDPAFGNDAFLKAEHVRAGIDARQYLRTRRLVIDSLTMKSPEFSLVRSEDGTWNWTTLGRTSPPPSARSGKSRLASAGVMTAITAMNPMTAITEMTGTVLSMSWLINSNGSAGARTLKSINLEKASVRLIDRSKPGPAVVLYKNITLNASLERRPSGDTAASTLARGDLVIQSGGDDPGADALNVALPFELLISESSPLSVSGSVGPGPLETSSVKIGGFTLTGDLRAERGKPLAAHGQLTGTEMLISTMNLSEQVSRAVRVERIGDMSAGTMIASLDADFQIDRGTINTRNLRLQQVDGLGDARAEKGSFKVDPFVTVNYAATITLTRDATAKLKSAGPMLGLLTTLLETNNQLSVPININGDLRRPEVRVDVNRIF
ncbi:MAG TPA: hypothetical protein VFV34_14640 [Blastocatellia bacterium]|nr:hypothetical protein [Blastocatellia bacterium]